MKQIKKGNEPNSLTEHKKKKKADYDNYPEKDELRESLCKEQRGICCYCMGVINPTVGKMKIEHYKCQANYPKEQLDYRNLLGACLGGEGLRETHCDTFKGNKDLNFYPPNPNVAIERMIIYGNDGSVSSANEQLHTELDSVLNLNADILKRNRKAALDGFKDSLSKFKSALSKDTIQKWIEDWSGSNHNGNLRPYCMVIVFWLQKKL